MTGSLSGLIAAEQPQRRRPGRKPHPGVSPRRRDVLLGVANGRSNDQIAKDLGLGVETVKTHLAFLTRQFEAKHRAHIVAIALRKGLLSPTEITVPGECPGGDARPNYCRCTCPGCQDDCQYHFGESGDAPPSERTS